MADNARIQNNVGTLNGRARPLLDNDTQELLARADAGTRANILRKMETELGAKLDVTVGGTKLTAKQVAKAVDDLYDAAIAPVGKSFDDAVKGFRELELKVGNMTDTVASRGGREIMDKTIDRLIDALSPQRQRTSAAVQTQTAAGVSDIARAADLDEPVVDTSRLQELMMPRLRVLLKEQATSQMSESCLRCCKSSCPKRLGQLKVHWRLTTSTSITRCLTPTHNAVEEKAQVIDDFVDQLSNDG